VVESTIDAVERGWVVVPGGADPASSSSRAARSHRKARASARAEPPPAPTTLKALFDAYEADLNPGAKEAGSLVIEAIHRGHLLRIAAKGIATVTDEGIEDHGYMEWDDDSYAEGADYYRHGTQDAPACDRPGEVSALLRVAPSDGSVRPGHRFDRVERGGDSVRGASREGAVGGNDEFVCMQAVSP
jgi:hypothetical protein